MHVLLIEDERKVASFIQRGLEAERYSVDVESDGEAGFLRLCDGKYDLVILDVMLPKRDGLTVLRNIRDRQLNVPVLLLTARDTTADKVAGLDQGADDYLTKPFRRKELLEAISARLAKHQAVIQQYMAERQRAEALQQKMQELQHINETQQGLLKKLISDLSNPLSNINMAIRLLKNPPPGGNSERYLEILQQEFDREIALLNPDCACWNF
jgi:DNA-binding response OmpR family regulator